VQQFGTSFLLTPSQSGYQAPKTVLHGHFGPGAYARIVIPSQTRLDSEGAVPNPPSLVALLSDWARDKMLVLGAGAMPVEGARGGVVALDAHGDTVLCVSLEKLSMRAPSQIADALDRLAQMNAVDLREVEAQPVPERSIPERFKAFFDQEATGLNRHQHAILIVTDEPDAATWRRLSSEIGSRLRGVYRRDGTELTRLSPPEPSRKAPPRPPLTWGTFVAIGAVVLGAGLALLAVVRVINPPAAPSAATIAPAIKTVATGVPGAATHTQWIGQQHLVHTSTGKLLAVFAVPGGVQIVADGADNGATWMKPASITSIHPESLSVAIDASGRLHIAYSDSGGVSYVVFSQAGGEWRPSSPVKLDATTHTPLVDIAWDEARQAAHVVWAKDVSGGQEPYWAVIASRSGKTAVVESGAVAAPADAIPVLVNEALDPTTGNLLVTYRDGTSTKGWESRILLPSSSRSWRWGHERRLPTDASIGAAALAYDAEGTAHLVLRDSTDYRLLYFVRPAGEGWSKPEIAVQAKATSQVDFPALALDRSSKLVYLFFESDQFETAPEIRVAIRDPNSGWKEATSVAALPEGAYFPTALRNGDGQAIALWTRGAAVPSLEAARVTSP
jgi:hypothetical protein